MNNLISEYENFLNKDLSIIVIFPFAHAGSDFVQGLLDNKKLINYPASQSAHALLTPDMIRLFCSEKIYKKDLNEIMLRLRRGLQRYFDPQKIQSLYDKFLENRKEISGIKLFKLMYFITAKLGEKNISEIKYLICHQHVISNNHKVEEFYFRNFNKKNIYFLFIMKDKRREISGVYRHMNEKFHSQLFHNEVKMFNRYWHRFPIMIKAELVNYFLRALYGYCHLYRFYLKYSDNSYVIKNEDFNIASEKSIRLLIKWLNLDWDENYLICTNQSKEWEAHKSTKKAKGNIFSKEHIEPFDHLPKNTVLYIELVQGFLLNEFGYEYKYIKTKTDFFKYFYILFLNNFEIKLDARRPIRYINRQPVDDESLIDRMGVLFRYLKTTKKGKNRVWNVIKQIMLISDVFIGLVCLFLFMSKTLKYVFKVQYHRVKLLYGWYLSYKHFNKKRI